MEQWVGECIDSIYDGCDLSHWNVTMLLLTVHCVPSVYQQTEQICRIVEVHFKYNVCDMYILVVN